MGEYIFTCDDGNFVVCSQCGNPHPKLYARRLSVTSREALKRVNSSIEEAPLDYLLRHHAPLTQASSVKFWHESEKRSYANEQFEPEFDGNGYRVMPPGERGRPKLKGEIDVDTWEPPVKLTKTFTPTIQAKKGKYPSFSGNYVKETYPSVPEPKPLAPEKKKETFKKENGAFIID